MPKKGTHKITPEQIVKQIELKVGNLTETAKALNVDRTTIWKMIKENPDLKDAIDQQRESNIDFAESQLRKLMTGYTLPDSRWNPAKKDWDAFQKHIGPDNVSVLFFLKTQAKHRGYIEKTELDISRIEKVEVVYEEMPIMKKVS